MKSQDNFKTMDIPKLYCIKDISDIIQKINLKNFFNAGIQEAHNDDIYYILPRLS